MKGVNQYKFAHPCYVCGRKLLIRQHFRHFKNVHPDRDTKSTCYLCLNTFRPRSTLLRHHRVCADQIYRAKKLKRGHLVLVGTNVSIKRPAYRSSSECVDHVLDIFNELEPVPSNIAAPQQIKLKYFDGKHIWDETQSQPFIQWLSCNESNVHDEKVRQIVTYLSLEDKGWYHVIVSLYHIERFAELAASVVQVTPYKCMCDGGNVNPDNRVLHAHMLVKIPDIKEFKRVCWSQLYSIDGRKFKKLIQIKSRIHLYNSIFYMSQTVKCTSKPGNKHHNLGVSLTDGHANMVLLLYRDIFYNHVLEAQRQRISFSRFDIYSFNDYFASLAEDVIYNTGFAKKIIVTGFALITADKYGPETLTVTGQNNTYINLIPRTSNTIKMADVLKADDIQNKFLVWSYHKTRQIKDMLHAEIQPRYRLALHCDEENFAIYGDDWRVSFRIPQEEDCVKAVLERAKYTNNKMIVINGEQREIMKTQYHINAQVQHITIPVLAPVDGSMTAAHITAQMLYRSGRERNSH